MTARPGRQSEDRVTARPLLSEAELQEAVDGIREFDTSGDYWNYEDRAAVELQQARAAIRLAESSLTLALSVTAMSKRGLDYVERARDTLRACLPTEDDAGSGVGVRG